MQTPPPELVASVERAAELRATGHAWESVGRDLGRPPATVRTWPRRYRAFWDQEIAAARHELTAAAGTEAVDFLRRQLRLEDGKAARDAAGKLLSGRENDPSPRPTRHVRRAPRLRRLPGGPVR